MLETVLNNGWPVAAWLSTLQFIWLMRVNHTYLIEALFSFEIFLNFGIIVFCFYLTNIIQS